MFRCNLSLIWLLLIPLTTLADHFPRQTQMNFTTVESAPARDEVIELSYHDEESLAYFVTMPNDFEDRSFFVRFTVPDLPFQLRTVKVILFDLFGDAGTPGMTVTIMNNDDGFPGESICEVELPPEELILNDDEELEWTRIDFREEELIWEDDEDFFVVFNVVQSENTDTLAILMDDGQAQPTDRSGFFNPQEGWITVEEAYDVGMNLAVKATIELLEIGELELSAELHDFGEVLVGSEQVWDFRMTNVGEGFLYVHDVSIGGISYQLDWTPPRLVNLDPWEIRADFDPGDGTYEGTVFVEGVYYISGRENDNDPGMIWGFDDEGDLIHHIDLPGNIAGGLQGLTWDWNTELIWGGSGQAIYGINLDGEINEMIDTPVEPGCIAWDRNRDLFWICDRNGSIFGLTREGDVDQEIETVQDISKQGLAYWPSDPDGNNLYIFTDEGDNEQDLYKLDTRNGEYVLVSDLFEDIERGTGGIDIAPSPVEYSWVFSGIMEDADGVRLRSYQLEEMPGLAPGTYYEGSARFTPDGNGEYIGRVDIASDAPGGEQLSIELRGTGIGGRDPRILEVPGDFDFIQMAIASAINRDTILVHPGRYFENIDFLGKRLVVGSMTIMNGDTSYIDSTIIDGTEQTCTVVFRNREDSLTVLRGFTITGGMQNFGGGIDCQANTCPQLLDLKVTGNSVWQIGGGIYCTWYSRPHIERVQIFGNTAMEGAGIGFAHQAHPQLVDVIITENQADENGGGVYAGHGTGEFTMRNVIISGNTANYGGGVYLNFTENIELFDVTIRDNTAISFGGGIYSTFTDPWIENCLITGNSVSQGNGGGIGCHIESSPILLNTVINNNSAIWGGGVYAFDESNPCFQKCVISNNNATHGGGGFDVASLSQPVLLNSIVIGNTADSIGNAMTVKYESKPLLANSILWNNGERSVFLEVDSLMGYAVVTNCDIEHGFDAFENGGEINVQYMEGNIDQDPLFVDPDEGDYYPAVESPCIDAGTAFFMWEGDTIIDLSQDEYYGEAPDIGLFETNYFLVDQANHELNTDFSLCGSFPNPFNSSTRILFNLDQQGPVSVKVFDLNGRLVTTLANAEYKAGNHVVEWDARNASTGIYLVRLESSSKSDTHRILLLR